VPTLRPSLHRGSTHGPIWAKLKPRSLLDLTIKLVRDHARAAAAALRRPTSAVLGRYPEAIASYDQVKRAIKPEHAELHRNKGFAALAMGDSRAVLAEYEWRWEIAQEGRKAQLHAAGVAWRRRYRGENDSATR